MEYITIKDVAKKLNVSISTISRAFNNKPDISSEKKKLIIKTAREMGYRPNPIARKLSQKRTFNIGIVVPEFIHSFFPEVIIGAQEILFDKGYQVLITQSNECYETELKNIKSLENSMVDGFLISQSSETKNTNYIQELIDKGYPIVFFNRMSKDIECSKVLFNDYKWSFFATEHLIRQGYKNIFHIQGTTSLTLSKERKRGFISALKKHKFDTSFEQVISTGFEMKDGEKIAQQLIDSKTIPDAIFAANDPLAIGAMRIFKQNGYKVPEDIAFVGFSESKFAEIMEPPLTSVVQPTKEIGIEAAKLLIEQIENPKRSPKNVELNGRLNIRESSINLKKT